MRVVLIGAAAVLLSACASIGTTPVAGTTPHGRGVPYYLPKVVFDVALTDFSEHSNAGVNIAQRYVADDAAGALSLGYGGSLFTSDTVTLVPNEQGLLTSVTLQSDSRAAEAFASLGTLAGSLEAGEVGDRTFVSETLDPTDSAELVQTSLAVSNALREWAYRRSHADTDAGRRLAYATMAQSSIGFEWVWDNAAAQTADAARNSAPCGRTNVCVRAARPGRLLVWRCGAMAVAPPATRQRRQRQQPQQPAALTQPARVTGVCGRGEGVLVGAMPASIPNDGPSVALPMQGGVFADTNHTLSLRNGMISEYRTTRASELEGAGTSAVGFVTAQARAVASGLQTETARVNAQTSLANARAGLVRAQQNLDAARKGQPAPTNNAASEEPTSGGNGSTEGQTGEGQGQQGEGQTEAGQAANNPSEPETTPTNGQQGEGQQDDQGEQGGQSAPEAPAVWTRGLFGRLTVQP